MRLLVPEKFLDESTESKELVEADFDLEGILAGAPREMEFKPDENGFYLMNDAIQIRYTKDGGPLQDKNIFELTFMGTSPQIGFMGDNAYMGYLAGVGAIKCKVISLENPDSRESEHLFRERPFWDYSDMVVIGKKEWYEEGESIMRKAAEKYKASEAYFGFKEWETRRAYGKVKAGVKSFLGKVPKFFGFMGRGKTGF